MEAKNVKDLMEAYASVYVSQEEVEQLDEDAKYDRNRKRAAQRAAARNAARDAGKTGAVPGVGYVTPRREKETYTDSAGVERHKTGARMPQKEETDLFDYILEHLVAEGYADTNEAAIAIMANMSEEWKQSIVEEVLDEAEGSYGQTPKATAAYGQLAIKRRQTPASEYSERGEKTKKVKSAEKNFYRTLNPDAGNRGKKSTKSIHPAGRQGMTQSDRDDANPEGPGSLPKGKKLERQRKTGKSAD
jgi:hypothetical protein